MYGVIVIKQMGINCVDGNVMKEFCDVNLKKSRNQVDIYKGELIFRKELILFFMLLFIVVEFGEGRFQVLCYFLLYYGIFIMN